jgi:hypothetical protein
MNITTHQNSSSATATSTESGNAVTSPDAGSSSANLVADLFERAESTGLFSTLANTQSATANSSVGGCRRTGNELCFTIQRGERTSLEDLASALDVSVAQLRAWNPDLAGYDKTACLPENMQISVALASPERAAQIQEAYGWLQTNWQDIAQGALDLAGFVPGLGEAADLVNAAWSAQRGDYFSAGCSLLAMIPGVGDAVGKTLKYALKTGGQQAALSALRALEKVDVIKFLDGLQSNSRVRPYAQKIRAALHEAILKLHKRAHPPVTPNPSRVGGKPKGAPEVPPARAGKEIIRGLNRQQQAAEALARAGYEVEYRALQGAGKNPDLLVNGKVFDVYAPTSGNLDNVRNGVSSKIKSGQTRRVVIFLEDSSVSLPALQTKLLLSKRVAGLEQVLVVRSGSVYPMLP